MKRFSTGSIRSFPHVLCSFQSSDFPQEMATALLQHHFAVVTDLSPDMQWAIDSLFDTTNLFFNSIHTENITPYLAPDVFNQPNGLTLPKQAFAGQMNAARYFINIDKNGVVCDQPLPKVGGNDDMRVATETFAGIMAHIRDSAMGGIEGALGLVDNVLLGQMQQGALVNLTRSYPLTQPRIRQMHAQGHLLVEHDSYRIAQIPPHRDFPPMSALVYPQNISGGLELRVKDGEGIKQVINVDHFGFSEQVVFVFTGRSLAELTNKNVSAARHSVMADPQMQAEECQRHPDNFRKFIGYFTLPFFNDGKIMPAKVRDGSLLRPPHGLKTADDHYPIDTEQFGRDYREFMDQREAAMRPIKPPEDLIAQYPEKARYEYLYAEQFDLDPDVLRRDDAENEEERLSKTLS